MKKENSCCDFDSFYPWARSDKPTVTRSAKPKEIYISTFPEGMSPFGRKFDEYRERIINNVAATEIMFKNDEYIRTHGFRRSMPQIKNVIFNDPATIVFWSDGTKTVVKCQEGDIYDPEKGLAMAISKKVLGNKHDYYHTFKHWLKKCPDVESKYPKVTLDIAAGLSKPYQEAKDAITKLNNALLIRRRL